MILPILFQSVVFGIFFRSSWFDERLIFPNNSQSSEDPVFLDNEVLSHIWTPDSYVDYGRDVKKISLESKSMMVQLYPNKMVFYSIM